jgi:mono/diheme cytochrome c family protein
MNQTNFSATHNRPFARVLMWSTGVLVVGFVLLQPVRFVIPEFQLDNPPVTQNVVWNSPETERLWNQACAACHSNETVYPWYAYVAPVGWLVAHDTHEGRDTLNISEDRRVERGEMIEVIEEGEMPPPIYITMHPEANLSDAQQEALIAGITATFR